MFYLTCNALWARDKKRVTISVTLFLVFRFNYWAC